MWFNWTLHEVLCRPYEVSRVCFRVSFLSRSWISADDKSLFPGFLSMIGARNTNVTVCGMWRRRGTGINGHRSEISPPGPPRSVGAATARFTRDASRFITRGVAFLQALCGLRRVADTVHDACAVKQTQAIEIAIADKLFSVLGLPFLHPSSLDSTGSPRFSAQIGFARQKTSRGQAICGEMEPILGTRMRGDWLGRRGFVGVKRCGLTERSTIGGSVCWKETARNAIAQDYTVLRLEIVRAWVLIRGF